MKVCMVTYSFYESDTRVMQYTSALLDRGDTVDVIALRQPGHEKCAVVNGARVFHIQERLINEKGSLDYLIRMLKFFFLSLCVLAKRHFTERYDLIHIHSLPDFLVFSAIVPKIFGAPVILDIHDLLPEFYVSKFQAKQSGVTFKLLLFVERICVMFADHVIVANHIWGERIAKRTGKEGKCSAICNYPDPKIFVRRQDARASHSGKFLIIFPGSLNWHQGVDIAVRAFAKAGAHLGDAEFHIYGEGPEKQGLIRLVRELKIEDRVLFHGYLPTEKIAEIMAGADLAIVPKRASCLFGNEAASTKIMEFMSLGVPLIVSKTRVDSYYFDDNLVCFFESENEMDLAGKIEYLYENPAYREKLSDNALGCVAANGWDRMKKEYYKVIEGIVRVPSDVKSSRPARNHSN